MAPPIVLAYWDIRGLAQPIRLLLEYSGAEWEDKYYRCGPAPDFDKSVWLGEKETLGFDFPNLPYLIDGDVKLTQTEAILRYTARKFKLEGQTDEEKRRVDLIVAESADLKAPFTNMCYNPGFATMKEGYLKGVHTRLERISKFLGSQNYFAGNNLTFADFVVYEALDEHKVLDPEILKSYKNLEEFLTRIENLDRISAYMKSTRYIKYPLNNKAASFGG